MFTTTEKTWKLAYPAQLTAWIVFIMFIGWLLPMPAAAHQGVNVGQYVLEIGWVKEPAVVGERNGLDLLITASGETGMAGGVTDAATTLEFAVEYGGVRHTYALRPLVGQPGRYTADLIPTREGTYTFHFAGNINGEAINVKFEPEPVEAADTLAFPEPLSSSPDLTSELAAAQAQANTAQMMAIGGLVLGLIGTGLGIYGVVKK
jgi:hypothetical protein